MIPGLFNRVAQRYHQVLRFFLFPFAIFILSAVRLSPSSSQDGCSNSRHHIFTSQNPKVRKRKEGLFHPHASFEERRKISPELHFLGDFSALLLARILSSAHPRPVVRELVRARDSQLWLSMNWGVFTYISRCYP